METSHRSPLGVALAALTLLAFPLAAQDPTPAVGPDPLLPDQLDQLRDMVKDRKMEQDYQAIELIRRVVGEPAKRHPKDRDRIVDALGDVFRLGRIRPPDQSQLYEAAADGLAEFGLDASKRLHKALEDERFDDREYRKLRSRMILALGRTADPRYADWLLDEALRSPWNEVMAAAGAALRNYTDLPTRKLRDVVKRLISRFGEIDMEARQLDRTDPAAPIDFGPQNARERLEVISGEWNATLQRLTGESLHSAPEWQHWYNKNKDWLPPGRER
ncbi:MAG: hypothetical protein AB7O97_11490 [Planctomycetota bacterium]